jgi:hypothetical protein
MERMKSNGDKGSSLSEVTSIANPLARATIQENSGASSQEEVGDPIMTSTGEAKVLEQVQ